MKTKLFYGWYLVSVSAIGIMFSAGAVLTFTFSVFILPLNQEFGWTRTELSIAYSLGALCFGALQPLVGKIIDRSGARRVILPSVVFVGLLLMSLYFLTANLLHFYLVYAAIGALGAGTGMAAYVNVISHWFDRRRGLALGLTIAGFGLGASMMPYLTHTLITEFGWQGAYLCLGALVMTISIPVVGAFLKESPQQMGLVPDGDDTKPERKQQGEVEEQQSLSLGEVWRTRTFWTMVVAFFCVSLAIHACVLHLVPILSDRGISTETAAYTASLFGIALICARVGTGYLLDKFNAAFVGACIFLASAFGVFLLYAISNNQLVFLAVLLVGLGFGAESDIIAYMVSRYFGLLHISEIYGCFYAVYILGAVIGPLLMGVAFDTAGHYKSALQVFMILMLVAAGLLFRLGSVRSRLR